MTSRDFVYWLQGYFEISGTKKISEQQAEMIQRHLQLVFKHEIDPSINGGNIQKQIDIQSIHDGKTVVSYTANHYVS
jgi:hypothetical protein